MSVWVNLSVPRIRTTVDWLGKTSIPRVSLLFCVAGAGGALLPYIHTTFGRLGALLHCVSVVCDLAQLFPDIKPSVDPQDP